MQNQTGSYAYGHFEQNDDELQRLKNQAGAAMEMERALLQRAGLKPDMDVLDLACGPGIVSLEIGRLVNGSVIGVDLNESLLAEAKAVGRNSGVNNVTFQREDVYALGLPESSFDFVYARFLFQHLAEPHQALRQIKRVLKPSGRLCITDVDDGWLTLYPDSQAFTSFIQRAGNGQKQNGGDRMVGRKLGYYLMESDFRDVKVNIHPVTSQDLGLQNFLNITTGLKREQVAEHEKDEAEQELAEIYAHAEQPGALGFLGLFVVTGDKPN